MKLGELKQEFLIGDCQLMVTGLILVALLIIVGLLSYVAYKITSAVRFLTKERVKTYTKILDYAHDCAHQMRVGGQPISPTQLNERYFDLLASIPTMNAYGNVFEALTNWNSKLKQNDGLSEVAAAQIAADRAIFDLQIAMRNDLKIGGRVGQIPNLEVFRAHQTKRAKTKQN